MIFLLNPQGVRSASPCYTRYARIASLSLPARGTICFAVAAKNSVKSNDILYPQGVRSATLCLTRKGYDLLRRVNFSCKRLAYARKKL